MTTMNDEARAATLVTGLAMAEAPRWHDGRLYLSDMHAGEVLCVAADGTTETVCAVEGTPGGLGWLPDGSLLVVSQYLRRVFRFDGRDLTVHADLSDLVADSSALNDMWVDGTGRAYVGEMGFDIHEYSRLVEAQDPAAYELIRPARLFVVQPDGAAAVASPEELLFCNGIQLSADGRTLVLAESFGLRLAFFDVDDDGALGGYRTVELSFPPDGIALGPDGNIWVASPVGKCAVLVTPEGVELRSVATDGICLAPALGGPYEQTLFLAVTQVTEPDAARSSRESVVQAFSLA